MPKRILVIDDEEAIRKAFLLALEDTDYEVDTVDSGAKGIEFKKSKRYDLIFLDLKMPGMNGVETLLKLRKMDEDVAVYIVTAFYGEFFEELERADEDGAYFEVLRKPISADEIVLVSKSILEGPIGY